MTQVSEPRKHAEWRHVLTHVDWDALTGTCANCGPVRLYRGLHYGKPYVRCSLAGKEWDKKHDHGGPRRRRKVLVDQCPRCHTAIEHPCQLDMDHVVPRFLGGADTTENLQPLCANCHRLKSQLERAGQLPEDFMSTYPLTVTT